MPGPILHSEDGRAITTSNRLPVDANVTLSAADIEIGAVEIKDATTDTRAVVDATYGLAVDVKRQASLPAGTNVIGHVIVDSASSVAVTSLPALPSGTNNIGDVDIVTVPTVGAHANAWNNAAVGVGGTSSTVDIQNTVFTNAFGHASAATIINFQVSQDNTNWYDSNISTTLAGAADFYLGGNIGARYIRLKSSAAATITATIASKD